MRKTLISLILCICLTTALTGCNVSVPAMQPSNQTTQEPPPQPVDSFMDVGKSVRIWYLQHNKDNEYQVGLRKNSTLVWYTIYPAKVVIEDEIEISYIERLPDEIGRVFTSTSYILHIKSGAAIQGGQYQQQRYKETPLNIPTQMIVGGGI